MRGHKYYMYINCSKSVGCKIVVSDECWRNGTEWFIVMRWLIWVNMTLPLMMSESKISRIMIPYHLTTVCRRICFSHIWPLIFLNCTVLSLYCITESFVFNLACTVGYARMNVIGYLFILAYIEIYVFQGNPFQAHSLEQSYHPTQPFQQEKYNTK